METKLTFKIFSKTQELPENWDDLAKETIFLSIAYLKILENASPVNITCGYIGIFHDEKLVGIALSQFFNLNKLESFGERDKCTKTFARNFIFRNFCSHVLLIGNNMFTGQNAFAFNPNYSDVSIVATLKLATEQLQVELKKQGFKVHIVSFKDFDASEIKAFKVPDFKNYYQFCIQPNMVFTISENWKSEQDYVDALSKKYRDQYKRARKKASSLEKCKMTLADIIEHEDVIFDLYIHVARNAPFNTFFLPKNHFRIFKEHLKENFLFYGYFEKEKLVGFNTLIKNGTAMDTYFLGYDDVLQKDKMLYLNMLYDMIAYSIKKGYKDIIFARTALEIKSSVGAKPIKMYGFAVHNNKILNRCMSTFFDFLEPKVIWNERNPFK